MAEHKHHLLKATYASPTNASFIHTHKLSAPPTHGTADKVVYLGALRKATAELQEYVNKELTSRMEEDRVREAGKSGIAKAKVADEAKAEDNYGEEVIEED